MKMPLSKKTYIASEFDKAKILLEPPKEKGFDGIEKNANKDIIKYFQDDTIFPFFNKKVLSHVNVNTILLLTFISSSCPRPIPTQI